MFQLVESIKIENKELQLIELHQRRIANAINEVFGFNPMYNLKEEIIIPDNLDQSRYKCRVSTSDGIHFSISIDPYIQRKIETVKIIECNDIDYKIKTTDRKKLDDLFAQRDQCDDILIVKNGLLTDSWASNIILFDGKNWITPNSPLLNGVQRQFLLSQKKITALKITKSDLYRFEKIKLINAMIDFNRAPEIKIDQIFE